MIPAFPERNGEWIQTPFRKKYSALAWKRRVTKVHLINSRGKYGRNAKPTKRRK